jgi:hypothetical protein
MAFTILTGGSFTSAGVGVKIPLPSSADYFVTTNVTQLATTQATGVCVRGEWYGPKFGAGATAVNDGFSWVKTNDTSAINIQLFSTASAPGFTYITSVPYVEPQSAAAITNITAANPAVVTQVNTYSNGDVLRFYSTTGILQIGGFDAQISSVSGAGYTLLGLPATAANGFAAAGTAGYTRRISTYGAVEPEFLYITNISQAASAVVSTSVDPSLHYVVGMKIYFSIPASYGMTQMNGLTGTITAVNGVEASVNVGAYNLTVNINSSAFTAFAWPASTSSPTAQLFATLSPAGASTQYDPVALVTTGYNFQYQPFRTGQFTPYMFIGGGNVQSPGGNTNDVINWACYKLES